MRIIKAEIVVAGVGYDFLFIIPPTTETDQAVQQVNEALNAVMKHNDYTMEDFVDMVEEHGLVQPEVTTFKQVRVVQRKPAVNAFRWKWEYKT